ncbi:MAG: diaminopimelate epimerase, partial [[Clostridium] fimetarium]|nr:diaminopimelate epimerase [[Clostridium] fimetarium]
GACATAVAAAVTGRAGREVTVRLLGGNLRIRWDEATNHIFMTGPATIVFDGVYYL